MSDEIFFFCISRNNGSRAIQVRKGRQRPDGSPIFEGSEVKTSVEPKSYEEAQKATRMAEELIHKENEKLKKDK